MQNKIPKVSPKNRCLAKNSLLEVELDKNGFYQIVWKKKSGVFYIGSGKSEDAAWLNCMTAWYGLKV